MSIRDVYDVLDSSLPSESYKGNRLYRIPSTKVFRMLIVRRDKRCALIASIPAEGIGVLTTFDEMAEDLRRASELISGALGVEDGSVLDLELVSCQTMLPYG